jgi:hypothetical protein
MSFSLRRLSWGFSALFISMMVLGSDAPAQENQKLQPNNLSLSTHTSEAETDNRLAQTRDHMDYGQAFDFANSAINQCYVEKDLEECEKLDKIKNALLTWCNEGDPYACKTYQNVDVLEMGERQAQFLEESFE